MYEADWAQPNPADLTDPAGPPLADEDRLFDKEALPETQTVLSELGAFYPIVSYPEAQLSEDGEQELDRTIYAGLVSP